MHPFSLRLGCWIDHVSIKILRILDLSWIIKSFLLIIFLHNLKMKISKNTSSSRYHCLYYYQCGILIRRACGCSCSCQPCHQTNNHRIREICKESETASSAEPSSGFSFVNTVIITIIIIFRKRALNSWSTDKSRARESVKMGHRDGDCKN